MASLCHGALAPKRRAACAPLLAKLRDALGDGRSVELRGAEAVELLAAAGERGDSIGVSGRREWREAWKGWMRRHRDE